MTERQATLNELANQKNQIEAGISDQEALYSQMSTSYKNAIAAQEAARGRGCGKLLVRLIRIGRGQPGVRSSAERVAPRRSPSLRRSP